MDDYKDEINLNDFIIAVNGVKFADLLKKIEDLLKKYQFDDINNNDKDAHLFFKTDLTQKELLKIRRESPDICLVWIYDKHPCMPSENQKHIEKEGINILKQFDVFIEGVKKDKDKYKKEDIKNFSEKLNKILTCFFKKERNEEEEYMLKAYKESKESIEHNRWVGAVIVDQNINKIISIGYNGYPKNGNNKEYGSISSQNRSSEVVHAEMDALLKATNKGNPVKDCVLYTTTFPCENCSKHIIKAGIKKLYYIEPYHKSKAESFYTDLIKLDNEKEQANEDKKIPFLHFEGIGPRKIF